MLSILAHFGSFSCGLQEKSPRLWAFLAATYWISFVAYFLLWKAYRHVSDMRATALMSAEVKNEQFAILVRDIPPVPEGQTRKEQVDSYFKTIYPETFYRSMVVTDNKKVLRICSTDFECFHLLVSYAPLVLLIAVCLSEMFDNTSWDSLFLKCYRQQARSTYVYANYQDYQVKVNSQKQAINM